MVKGSKKETRLERRDGVVKRRWHIKAAAFLLACFTFLWGFPPEGRAADAGALTLDVADGSVTITSQGYYIGDSQQLNPYTGNYIFTGETAENSVLVESFDAGRSITLNGLSIDVSGKKGQAAFRIAETCGEDVQLLLSGTNTLKGGKNAAGLEYPAKTDRDNKAKLILDSASGSGSLEGSLEAYAGGSAAGIGGGGVHGTYHADSPTAVLDFDQPLFCGHMEIRGGTIACTANPAEENLGYGGAGLGTGGGLKGANGDDPEWDSFEIPGSISILGGKVTAVGQGTNIGGAGIGTGSIESGGYGLLLPITIAGGEVTATGGFGGAGIGGGSNCASGKITITGGAVTATGGTEDDFFSGAGIGGGDMSFSSEITIGGTAVVTARGGSLAAGIGGGQSGECFGPIVIEGGAQVIAYGGSSKGGFGGAGVGAGQSYSVDARFISPLEIKDSAKLTAYAGAGSMAVGLGKDYTGESEPAPIRIESESVELKLFNRDTSLPACPAAEGEFAGRLLVCTLEPGAELPAAGERAEVPGTAACEWSYTGESGNYSLKAFQGDTALGTFSSQSASLGNWAVLTGENIELKNPVVPTPPAPPAVEPEPEPDFPFVDVPPDTWYRDSVEFVWKLGMIEGMTPESYVPGNRMERGMVAVMLYRLEGKPEAANGGFADVEDSAYYAAAAAWGRESGIVQGYGGDVFGPRDKVTREQLASILYRYAAYRGWDIAGSGSLEHFKDSSRVSDWAKEALEWAVDAGVLLGYDDGTLRPGEDATRAEVAQMFMRFCTKYR